MTENTNKLVVRIVEYLEQFEIAVGFAVQRLSSLCENLNGNEVDKTNDHQRLSSTFREYKDSLKASIEKLNNSKVFSEVLNGMSDTIFYIIIFFNRV